MNWLETFSIPEPNSGCWLWLGATSRGYGIVVLPRSQKRKNRNLLAHRLSYQDFVGPIPPGMGVLHHCDNPSCVNPQHLYCGTHRDNGRDALRRGRLRPTGKKPKLTPHDVAAILSSKEGTVSLAKKYGVHRHTIQLVRSKKTWQEWTL